MKLEKVNLESKFDRINEHWSPKIVGELNGQMVKLAKFKGEFVKHSHQNEDELFYVVNGTLFIEFNDQTIELKKGELIVVPRGVEHKPYAPKEVEVMLFEPSETINTGNARSHLRLDKLDRI